MRRDADCLTPAATPRSARRHQRFLEYLIVFLALGVLAFLALLYVLKAIGSLPAPPITATYCIDEKFKFLAERDIEDTDLLAVGSSVTWRNLHMEPFIERRVARRPLNGAPCYLHMDQAAFLTRFLLDHLRRVEVVVSVVAPRDFADCNAADRAFFSPERAASYVFDGASPLAIYAMNFRPISFLRDAIHIAEKRSSPKAHGPLVMDAYGSGPIEGRSAWSEPPRFDHRCFAALGDLEALLAARGVRLAVVSFPSSPQWHAEHDPDGAITREFESRLRQVLSDEGSLVAPSQRFGFDESLYFDYVHLQWRGAQRFSAAVADWLATEGVRVGGV